MLHFAHHVQRRAGAGNRLTGCTQELDWLGASGMNWVRLGGIVTGVKFECDQQNLLHAQSHAKL